MKKLTAVLFAAAFSFAAGMPAFAENAEAYAESAYDQEADSSPVSEIQEALKQEEPVHQPANEKETKKNAAALKAQAEEMIDKAKADKKKIDLEAIDIKTKAKNEEKLAGDKIKNMKDMATAEKSRLENEAKMLEEKAKAIRDKAKALYKDNMHEITVLTQNAQSAKDAEFKRADDMSSAAAKRLTDAERQASLLLKSIEQK